MFYRLNFSDISFFPLKFNIKKMFSFSNMKYHPIKQTELSRQNKKKWGGGMPILNKNVI